MSDEFERVRPTEASRNAATCLALVGILIVAGGLLALTAMVLPQIRGLLLVAGGLGLFITLHFVTWGWWLSRAPRGEDREAE